ncbi:tetratricopeptide repeat protein [Providencia rettgeri]|uniref:tetratricopeptide repeat protein n=1 Tax=Providencia rettgeri TaxID=587 RepID=UPI0024484131|nr:hypothetical protein [Providencia rettgeri]MDH2379697.1 hypothetical protein [Providencia rettgeri]HEM7134020.1 sel1 repeat family protein [Providencia rettgeri]
MRKFFFALVVLCFIPTVSFSKTTQQKESECRQGSSYNCYAAGGDYQRGEKVRQDYKKAKELYEIGCNGGDLNACTRLANLYLEGKGTPKNKQYAKELHMDTCFRSSHTPDNYDPGVESCIHLGKIYKDANLLDLAKAAFGQACDKNSTWGCEEYRKMNN